MAGTAAIGYPSWSPHPDVWLVVGLLAAGYAIALTRLGPRLAPSRPAASRFELACFTLGLVTLWLSSDWPIHDVAEGHNYSIHMVQHLLFTMVAAPLLLLGTPAWLARWVLSPAWLFRAVWWLARFVPALVVFNVVLVVTHWPWLVDQSVRSAPVHFGLHALLFGSSLVVWLPVVSPLPEILRLQPVLRVLYLFAWSVVPTVPASFLTFGSAPLYKYYEGLPHLYGLTTLEDQQLAGLIMKIGGGLLLWLVIAVVFFRWAAEEDRANTPRHGLAELDRELTGMGLRR